MAEVEAGKSYELAVTTGWGLYRYRIGDVVKVVGFYSDDSSASSNAYVAKAGRGAPLIEFGYRLGQLLNVRGEKTSEQAMLEALHASVSAWHERDVGAAGLVDYCCVDPAIPLASFLAEPHRLPPDDSAEERAPRYDLFVELEEMEDKRVDEAWWTQRAEIVDEELCRSNPVYRSFRVKNGIGKHKPRASCDIHTCACGI
jgi:hypothetical protein